jgi:hypothetical protein
MSARRTQPGLARPVRLPGICLCAALTACTPWQSSAPVTAVSYQTSREQLQRTVGKLRRLAALQVRIVPRVCAGGTDGVGRLTALDPTARDLLAQRKGYELIEPDGALPLAGVGDPQEATSAALVADLLAAKDAAQPVGPALAAWLGRLRERERVDGLLVLKQEVSCLKSSPMTRGLLALGTFGITEALGLAVGGMDAPTDEYLDVVVFETASSRMVWRNVYGRLEQELVKPPMTLAGPGHVDAVRAWSITHVLEALEPAVPRLLTR